MPLHLPLLLALWTGQRQGDLLRLPWSAYNGSTIRLKQSKTGARVEVPVGAPLKAALDAFIRRDISLVEAQRVTADFQNELTRTHARRGASAGAR